MSCLILGFSIFNLTFGENGLASPRLASPRFVCVWAAFVIFFLIFSVCIGQKWVDLIISVKMVYQIDVSNVTV